MIRKLISKKPLESLFLLKAQGNKSKTILAKQILPSSLGFAFLYY